MARVQYGALVTGLSGSIGGITFQNNASGSIARLKSGTPKNPTVNQSIAQQNITKYISLWQQLTLAEKTAWNNYAVLWTKTDEFGNVKTLTGLNWFQSVNYNLELVGSAITNTPPVHTLPTGVPSYTLTLSATSAIITFSPAFNPTNQALIIRATPPLSRSSTSTRQDMRLIKVLTAGPYSTIDITADWEAYFGLIWADIQAPFCYTIAVSIQTIEKTSGIASSGVLAISQNSLNNIGVGYMIVGSTNIVG